MILLINTCGAEAVAALAEGSRIVTGNVAGNFAGNAGVVAQESLPGRVASEQLIPALRRLLSFGGELEAVGVVHGPGSFTGVRVGLSAAKGVCEARSCGLMAMSRLQLVALEAQQQDALAVLDAGRGEYYCGLYRSGTLEREEILSVDALVAAARGRNVITCEPRVQEMLSHHVELALVEEPGALAMLSLVCGRIERGEWSDVAAIDANYLRRTDAELLAEAR